MTREQLKSVLDGPISQIIDKLNCIALGTGGPINDLESDPYPICITATSATLLQWVVKTNGVPNGTIIYTDLIGTIVPTPAPGTFTFGTCSNPTANVLQRCLCDDVNGNGSVIQSFTQFYTYDSVTNTITVTGNWKNDLTGTYTPTNIIQCDSIGTTAKLVLRRVHLTGVQSWSMPVTATSITLMIRRIGDVLNPATLTDNAGVTTPLFLGDVITYGVTGSQDLLQGSFSIDLKTAGDTITIHYEELI